ncbi:MAG: DNA repair protein RadC [Lachnospiraceae bacterium]|nr:DNA repair protein RadC [Lachnospiraceae bacterium]
MNCIVKELPESERPYEKCRKYGVQILSDAELLAVIMRTGTSGMNSLELAHKVLSACDRDNSIAGLESLGLEELMAIKGIGFVKAIQLKCLTEFSKRLWRSRRAESRQFVMPSDCADYYMEQLRYLDHEEAYIMMLDNKCSFIGDYRLSQGTVNATIVSTRDIFITALKRHAVKIILVHNHPSGDPEPSSADISLAEKVAEAGKILDITLNDSIIIGDGKYISLREKKILI